MTYFLVLLNYCWPLFNKNATLQMSFFPFFLSPSGKTHRASADLTSAWSKARYMPGCSETEFASLSALKADWKVHWAVSTYDVLFSEVIWGWNFSCPICMAKKGCPRAELALPLLRWRHFVEDLSYSRGMAGCTGALRWLNWLPGNTAGREGVFTAAHLTYRHKAACTDNHFAPYSLQYF